MITIGQAIFREETTFGSIIHQLVSGQIPNSDAKEELLLNVNFKHEKMNTYPHEYWDTFDFASSLFSTDNIVLDSKLADLHIGTYSMCENLLCPIYQQKVVGNDSKMNSPILLLPMEYYKRSMSGNHIQNLLESEINAPKYHVACAKCQCRCVKRNEYKENRERPIFLAIVLNRYVYDECFTMGELDSKIVVFGVEYSLSSVAYVDDKLHYLSLIATKVEELQGIFKCDSMVRGGEFVPIDMNHPDFGMFPDHMGKGIEAHYYPPVDDSSKPGQRKTKNSKKAVQAMNVKVFTSKPKVVHGYVAHTLHYIRSDMMKFQV